MPKLTSILIVGVGGQGTILASKILGSVALALGGEVKLSEIHGMAQRGGSVVTQVRFGEKVASPIIEKGQADIILAFEKMEALRYLPFLKKGGTILINDQEIPPMPVIIGSAQYPENIYDKIADNGAVIKRINAVELARTCGTAKATNVVLLGLLAKYMEIDKHIWLNAVKENVPAKVLEINLNAFESGYSIN